MQDFKATIFRKKLILDGELRLDKNVNFIFTLYTWKMFLNWIANKNPIFMCSSRQSRIHFKLQFSVAFDAPAGKKMNIIKTP